MKEALLKKRYGIPVVLLLALLLSGTALAWYSFNTISSETTVQEPLSKVSVTVKAYWVPLGSSLTIRVPFAIYDTYDGSEPFKASEIKDFDPSKLKGLLASGRTSATVEVKGGVNYIVYKTYLNNVLGVWSYRATGANRQLTLYYKYHEGKDTLLTSGTCAEKLFSHKHDGETTFIKIE